MADWIGGMQAWSFWIYWQKWGCRMTLRARSLRRRCSTGGRCWHCWPPATAARHFCAWQHGCVPRFAPAMLPQTASPSPLLAQQLFFDCSIDRCMCSGMVASDSDGVSARLQEGVWWKRKQERGQKKTRQTRWRLIGAQRALPCRQPAARMLSRRPSRLCNCSCQAALFSGACASCRSGPSLRSSQDSSVPSSQCGMSCCTATECFGSSLTIVCAVRGELPVPGDGGPSGSAHPLHDTAPCQAPRCHQSSCSPNLHISKLGSPMAVSP